MIDPLEKYLNELSSKIESVTDKGKEVYKIDFSRYTLDVKNEPQFYINEFRNVVVDIENFIVVFEAIHTSLNNIANHYLYYNEENLSGIQC
ncbi:hypothetical protein ACQJ0Y_14415 [Peribacillus simplex]|uniref:hypothetical protein n=1 Tax=Peribacillus simplex TaxID=1478 RepID=UPI003CEF85DD